jgi:hypothetical protein
VEDLSNGMKLPNADRAFVDMAKLQGYCLNVNHRRGQHKARVFAAALGLTTEDADFLREVLLSAAQSYDAVTTEEIEYGQLYGLDFPISKPVGRAMVRSGWIVGKDEDLPRLTNCYVL